MKALITMICSLVLLGWAGVVSAQEGTYRLQPDDVLRIQVYNETAIMAVVPVGKDGNISAPFVGVIRAAGKTTSELEADLRDEYTKIVHLKDPIVGVTIEKYRVMRASVGGSINRPGTYEIRQGDTLLSLLNMGGGTLPDRADAKRATLRRGNSAELIPIDIDSMLKGDTSQDYVLQDGDELTVPEETRNRILVTGMLSQPGTYPFKEPMTLYDAISLARGAVPYKSKLSKVLVIRQIPGHPGEYMQIQADLVKFIHKGDATQNIPLMANDIVWVPETGNIDFNQVTAIANIMFILDRVGFRVLPNNGG